MLDYVIDDVSPMGSATQLALIIAIWIVGIGAILSMLQIIWRQRTSGRLFRARRLETPLGRGGHVEPSVLPDRHAV